MCQRVAGIYRRLGKLAILILLMVRLLFVAALGDIDID